MMSLNVNWYVHTTNGRQHRPKDGARPGTSFSMKYIVSPAGPCLRQALMVGPRVLPYNKKDVASDDKHDIIIIAWFYSRIVIRAWHKR